MAGLDGFGTMLERSDMAEPAVFTPIANVTNFSGPETERNTIDVTAHDSPDGWMEFRGGLKDGGEVTLEVNFDPVEHVILLADYDDKDPRDYRLTFPDGTSTWTFKAIMTGFSSEEPDDDKISGEITFKVSGKPALTAA